MEKLNESELWLLDVKGSKGIDKKDLAIDSPVIAVMKPLMNYPFAGVIEKIYENSALVRVDNFCPIEPVGVECDRIRLATLAGRIVVPIKNIMPNDKTKVELNSPRQSVNGLHMKKESIDKKIRNAKNTINVLTEENEKYKKEEIELREKLTETHNKLKCAKSKQRELLKWVSSATEKGKDAAQEIARLKKLIDATQLKIDTIKEIRENNQNDIANLHVKLGQLSIKKDAAQDVIEKAIAMTNVHARIEETA